MGSWCLKWLCMSVPSLSNTCLNKHSESTFEKVDKKILKKNAKVGWYSQARSDLLSQGLIPIPSQTWWNWYESTIWKKFKKIRKIIIMILQVWFGLWKKTWLLFPINLRIRPAIRTNPPVKGWVSTDRSMGTALPSTTPRPVRKSSTDDSTFWHHHKWSASWGRPTERQLSLGR